MFILWNVFPDKLGWKKNFVIWGYSNQLCLNCHDLQACSGAQSCLTPCDPMDCNPPDCSVSGISQAGLLEWVAISSSRGSSRHGDQTLRLLHWQADSLPLQHLGQHQSLPRLEALLPCGLVREEKLHCTFIWAGLSSKQGDWYERAVVTVWIWDGLGVTTLVLP